MTIALVVFIPFICFVWWLAYVTLKEEEVR